MQTWSSFSEDCAETDFYALNLQCYEVGRVGEEAE